MTTINPVGNGLSGTTGTGNFVGATSPTLVTPAIGTPSSGTLTNCTGLPVAGGGTGNSTFTAYSVVCAGTTATGIFQNVSGVGSSGQVLTSNGASALPTWQAAGGGGPWSAGAGTNSGIGGDGTETAAGNYSLTYGTSSSSCASTSSFVFGAGCSSTKTTNGNYNFVFGNGSYTTNTNYSHVFGQTCYATANYAVVFGTGCNVGNTGGFAGGSSCSVTGSYGFSYGNSNNAGLYGFAFGNGSTATGGYALAFGNSASVQSEYGVAIGQNATVGHTGSWVIVDGSATAKADSATNQFCATFGNGFYLYSSSTNNLLTLTTTGSSLIATNTNDNASSGYVGEFVSSVVAYASAISLTTTTAANVTSISLTAGDWDINGNVFFQPSVGATALDCWSSSTSATAPDASLINELTGTALGSQGFSMPFKRYSLSTTTTIYLSVEAIFASGTCTACGGIYARRAR